MGLELRDMSAGVHRRVERVGALLATKADQSAALALRDRVEDVDGRLRGLASVAEGTLEGQSELRARVGDAVTMAQWREVQSLLADISIRKEISPRLGQFLSLKKCPKWLAE